MATQLIIFICILVCLVALYIAYKVYKDSRKLKKRMMEEDEETIRF